MYEVYQTNEGWRWRFICTEGRELFRSRYAYPTQADAVTRARYKRLTFFLLASAVDHRQGACF